MSDKKKKCRVSPKEHPLKRSPLIDMYCESSKDVIIPSAPYAAHSGYIYLIENDIGRVKVGKSANPGLRIKGFELSSGIKIVKIHIWGPFSGAFGVERNIHKRLSKYAWVSEWYKVDYSYARAVCSSEIELNGDGFYGDVGRASCFEYPFKSKKMERLFPEISHMCKYMSRNRIYLTAIFTHLLCREHAAMG